MIISVYIKQYVIHFKLTNEIISLNYLINLLALLLVNPPEVQFGDLESALEV